MTHYQDIHLLPDAMSNVSVLMSILFSRLHVALVRLRKSEIGVSFPEFEKTLGSCLRLHGNLPVLLELDALHWYGPLISHICKDGVLPVPNKLEGYRTVRRKQFKSNPERLRRRLIRRHNISVEDAIRRVSDDSARMTDLPFIKIKSASTGQRFRLFVEHGPLQEQMCYGKFSLYGLSATSTIPWF